MTRDEVLAMKPGRELDALVAEKVMGWKAVQVFDLKDTDGTNIANGITPYNIGQRVPHYSTDIASAWEVVEEMQNNEWDFTLKNHKRKYEAIFGTLYNAFAPTAPEAICKAALLAVMGKWR